MELPVSPESGLQWHDETPPEAPEMRWHAQDSEGHVLARGFQIIQRVSRLSQVKAPSR